MSISHFQARQDQLMKQYPDAIFLFPAASHQFRNGDVHYPYRQESSFFYLTGFEESNAFLVLVPQPIHQKTYRSILFLSPKDPIKELWEGKMIGIEGALENYPVDEAYPYSDLLKTLPRLFSHAQRVFYHLGRDRELDHQIIHALKAYQQSLGRTGLPFLSIEDSFGPLGEMRIRKRPEEIENIKKSCEISAQAHRKVLSEVRAGMKECEVAHLIDFYFYQGGCQRLGYESIVAGGKNAAVLHYQPHSDLLKEGDLLLIDAGGEFNYYSADITRTFPIGRKFTPVQAQLYDLVLEVQKKAIQQVKPGISLQAIHQKVSENLTKGLVKLGFLKKEKLDLLRFYPHRTGHWLGMDVHDVGLYQVEKQPRLLEPNMVFTIEPGLYIQPTDSLVNEGYPSLGIRIEDDILVTETGCEVLTQGVPKERSEIEDLRNG